jgi:hypothetical protein
VIVFKVLRRPWHGQHYRSGTLPQWAWLPPMPCVRQRHSGAWPQVRVDFGAEKVVNRYGLRSGTSMSTTFKILAIVVIAAVVIVLVRGLFNMARGGSPSKSNQLMQARVLLQFIAIVLVLLAVWFTR